MVPSALIRTFDAKDVFGLQKYHDQDLTLDHLTEIPKQNILEETEEPEPEPKERRRTIIIFINCS
jgi:hypothetical protein